MKDFIDHLLFVGAVVWVAHLFLTRSPIVANAQSSVPFWYTAAGTNAPKEFDYSSQSNYAQEAQDHNGY